jgi:hypothetical protein
VVEVLTDDENDDEKRERSYRRVGHNPSKRQRKSGSEGGDGGDDKTLQRTRQKETHAIVTSETSRRCKMKQTAKDFHKEWMQKEKGRIEREHIGPNEMKRKKCAFAKLVMDVCVQCARYRTDLTTEEHLYSFLKLLVPRVHKNYINEHLHSDSQKTRMKEEILKCSLDVSASLSIDTVREQTRVDYIHKLYVDMKGHVQRSGQLNERQRDVFLRGAETIRNEMLARREELDDKRKINSYLHERLVELKDTAQRLTQRRVFENDGTFACSGVPLQFSSMPRHPSTRPLQPSDAALNGSAPSQSIVPSSGVGGIGAGSGGTRLFGTNNVSFSISIFILSVNTSR